VTKPPESLDPGRIASYAEATALIERQPLRQRLELLAPLVEAGLRGPRALHLRMLSSAMDREVEMLDPATGRTRMMLMFGSNNYLGLASHPHVRERAIKAIERHGPGLGAAPLIGGYTDLHRELEARIAEFKQTEDSILFATGFMANMAVLSTLPGQRDVVVADEYVHASVADRLHGGSYKRVRWFRHNDVSDLQRVLDRHAPSSEQDVFVAVEGVNSMEGDIAPLAEIVSLCRARNAITILDDAHGDGVLGAHGRGTAEHCGVEGQLDVVVGTFSKVFATIGGFVAGTRAMVNYLRAFARAYMFSASPPPVVLATVLGGLEVLEREPQRIEALHANVRYVGERLRHIGVRVDTAAAIIPLKIPGGIDIREMGRRFQESGLFMNVIEYPAVSLKARQFRISIMATHTREDLDRLVHTIADVGAHVGWLAPGPVGRGQ
jgi:glycine C-acetyltransferase